jgi:lipopolysaccharide export system permease protein
VALLLGGFSRFGVTRQILIAVVLAILFQMVSNMAVDAARSSVALAWLLYLPAILGAVAVAAMVWLANRPALLSRLGVIGRTRRGVPA